MGGRDRPAPSARSQLGGLRQRVRVVGRVADVRRLRHRIRALGSQRSADVRNVRGLPLRRARRYGQRGDVRPSVGPGGVGGDGRVARGDGDRRAVVRVGRLLDGRLGECRRRSRRRCVRPVVARSANVRNDRRDHGDGRWHSRNDPDRTVRDDAALGMARGDAASHGSPYRAHQRSADGSFGIRRVLRSACSRDRGEHGRHPAAHGRRGRRPSGRRRSRRPNRNLVAPQVGVLVGIAGVLVAAGALTGHPIGILGIAAGYGLAHNAMVVADARLQAVITGPARATVTSVAGFSSEMFAIGCYATFAVGSWWLTTGTLIASCASPSLASPVRCGCGGPTRRGDQSTMPVVAHVGRRRGICESSTPISAGYRASGAHGSPGRAGAVGHGVILGV